MLNKDLFALPSNKYLMYEMYIDVEIITLMCENIKVLLENENVNRTKNDAIK
jgi:hypothetical protein